MTHPDDIRAYQEVLKEGSEKLGRLLAEANTVKNGLEIAAAEAESEGHPAFAAIFRALAAQSGQLFNGVASVGRPPAKRRGRTAKSGAVQPASEA